ncbi:hypothetical protein H1R20_g2882, partial [Candolleomyces eurysporus]
MGVLAKAWLSNLVSPALNRDAKDAYHRYRLDNNASALQTIMTLMFLLVQLACILFLAGLVVQVTADDPSVGRVILAFCASGGLIYLTVTFLPLYFPFSPFRTPLLDLLLSLKPSVRGALLPGGKMRPKEIDECLAEILNLHLIRSSDPSRIDEAVAELALPSFKVKWLAYLYRNEALGYLLKGLNRCALTQTNDEDEQDKILSNYIVVFLRFLDYFDAKLITTDERVLSFINDLRESSESGPPMLLWNASHVTLRPLLLCLKMKVLCLSTQSSDDRKIFDFHPDEVAVCPWRWVLEPINSSHRKHLMSAACHGVMEGQKNIKKISISILNLTLAQTAKTASEGANATERAKMLQPDFDPVLNFAAEYLVELYQSIDVSHWLNDATAPRFLWTSVPENLVNVFGIFKNHLTVDMPFLSKLVEMAANGGE